MMDLLKMNIHWLFKLIKEARFFRFDKGRYLFVGRDKESNMKLMNIGKKKSKILYPQCRSSRTSFNC